MSTVEWVIVGLVVMGLFAFAMSVSEGRARSEWDEAVRSGREDEAARREREAAAFGERMEAEAERRRRLLDS